MVAPAWRPDELPEHGRGRNERARELVTRSGGFDPGEALAAAHWPSLLCALARLTGDPGAILALLPAKLDVLDRQGGMSADQQRAARAYALPVLRALLGGDLRPPVVDEALARELLAPMLGADLDAYAELAGEELSLRQEDPRAPGWTQTDIAPGTACSVIVIGAGMSGLLAAHRMRQAGLEVTVLEKNPGLGGTWFENTYPGCRVDVPSHLYTYSCGSDTDWSAHFATQPEILAGFERFAAETGVRECIRFGVAVASLEWQGSWRVQTSAGTLHADVVVSAVGQLNRPAIPDIAGRDTFAGPAFHSAAWDHGALIDGARVAVVGNGASGMQVIPPVAQRAAHTSIFARTPCWMIPTPGFRDEVDPRLRWLFRVVPGYQRWYRYWLLRGVSDALLPYATSDPGWDGTGASGSFLNDRVRIRLTDYLEAQFADHPDLLAKVQPDHPPFAKRGVRDDGTWAATLTRDDVALVTTPIAGIESNGIRTGDDTLHEADVLIWSTGFHAADFLLPMRVTGRDGADLHEQWCGAPSAYLGMTVPAFPNFFLLYGPNTNIVVNGSAIFFSECEVRHLLACLRLLVERDGEPIEVSAEAHDRFVAEVDELSATRVWATSDVNSWYRSASGRSSQNWPGTVLDYWARTRTADPADYPARTI
ncbi:MAG: flavin-containing monooxygenase [Sporichthyaceae bacterium]